MQTKGRAVVNASGTYGARAADSGDGWSQARSSRASNAGQPLPPELNPRKNAPERRPSPSGSVADEPRRSPRVVVNPNAANGANASNGSNGSVAHQHPQHAPASAFQQAREAVASPKPDEHGLPAWGALIVLLAIAAVGMVIDQVSGAQARSGFNIGIVVASIVAILVVRRSSMFPVVVAPPIVYSAASGILLYARSNGLHDRKVLIDTAANWLVYGFPAIAAATASVLIIAGVRMLIRR